MQKVFLTVGTIASGKTTWSKDLVSKDPTFYRVSRDDIRQSLFNYQKSGNEKIVIEQRDFAIKSILKSGLNLVIDETFLNKESIDRVLNVVKASGVTCEVEEKIFLVSLQDSLERNSKRDLVIPEDACRAFYKKAISQNLDKRKPRNWTFNADALKVTNSKYIPDKSLPKAILCDIDGTCSLFNKLDKSGNKMHMEYENTHFRNPYDASNADNDSINEPVRDVLLLLREKNHKIIFVSGRKDLYKEQTVSFLNKHIGGEYELLMRKSDDQRPDYVVKLEIFDNFIRNKYNVKLVLDDRKSLVDSWRAIGLSCWQVNEGNF